jgi:hypothetical protein
VRNDSLASPANDEEALLDDLLALGNPDDVIPQLARDQKTIARIESIVRRRHGNHELMLGDARNASHLAENSIHLAVTSPPYWTLKRYNESDDQLGQSSEQQRERDYGENTDNESIIVCRCRPCFGRGILSAACHGSVSAGTRSLA